MRIEFWGVRGSIPAPGPNTVRTGGNTPCVSARLDGEWVVFDAGTGIRSLGQRILESDETPHLSLFLSHVHWDHIQGFPFFQPALRAKATILVHGAESHDHTLSSIVHGQMEGPNFPVSLDRMGGDIRFLPLPEGGIVPVQHDRAAPVGSVANARLNHPDGVLGYRLVEEGTGARLVYATDTEHTEGHLDEALVELARDADILVYDGMYTPEEYPSRQGWGHSTWMEGIRVAHAAGVKHLVVFHHDPDRSDDQIDELERKACAHAAENARGLRLSFAREGMSLEVGGA